MRLLGCIVLMFGLMGCLAGPINPVFYLAGGLAVVLGITIILAEYEHEDEERKER